jgi:hypothetical protein
LGTMGGLPIKITQDSSPATREPVLPTQRPEPTSDTGCQKRISRLELKHQYARGAMRRKPIQLPDMPPLGAPPAPMPPSSRQHNGGPPLEPRRPGRPGISTPELRERLLGLLCEGLPLRATCRMPGMPSREAVYAWRRIDPACRFMAQEGHRRT